MEVEADDENDAHSRTPPPPHHHEVVDAYTSVNRKEDPMAPAANAIVAFVGPPTPMPSDHCQSNVKASLSGNNLYLRTLAYWNS